MLQLSFAEQPLIRMRQMEGQPQLFCPVRKRWVKITEEEWVRQNLMETLQRDYQYPLRTMAVEKALVFGGKRKRFDLLIYAAGRPWMVVECKEPDVPLGPPVLQQALEYNSRLEADFLLLSNGRQHHCWQLKPVVGELNTLPLYPDGQ